MDKSHGLIMSAIYPTYRMKFVKESVQHADRTVELACTAEPLKWTVYQTWWPPPTSARTSHPRTKRADFGMNEAKARAYYEKRARLLLIKQAADALGV